MKQEEEIKKHVKKRYAEIAQGAPRPRSCSSSEAPSCCSSVYEKTKAIGYSDSEIESVPPEAAMGLGCGNPTALAELKRGETVLDLGSGGGFDVFLAAGKVGKNGHVIGVDMTEEIVEKARRIAISYGYDVEFRLGEIEDLPVESSSVDVIISNCVINLSPDKLTTFKEALRVLVPGGRLLVSDMVTVGELPEEVKGDPDSWADCIAGALKREEYLDTIKRAGFRSVEVVAEHPILKPRGDERLTGKIISIKVRAYKGKKGTF